MVQCGTCAVPECVVVVLTRCLDDQPHKFDIRQVPIPKCGDDDVLLKVSCCGVCGTDGHIHEGEFIATFPLIPGHEAIGKVIEIGKNVKDFALGDRVVADVGISVRFRVAPRAYTLISMAAHSAITASTVGADKPCFARTSTRVESHRMAVSQNTLFSGYMRPMTSVIGH